MKKIILAFAVIAISAGAYAQTESIDRKSGTQDIHNNHNQNLQNNPADRTYPDGVIMQHGKMMRVKDGQVTLIQDNDMTLTNGTRIMSDGNYIRQDGTKILLNEGQHMDMSGNVITTNNDRYMNVNSNMQSYPIDKTNTDGVMMHNGRMMRMENGQMSTYQDNEVIMDDGTRVMSDGTCIYKDGSKVMMKEGQHMDKSGRMIHPKTSKDNNMYLVPDSTLRDKK